MRYRYRHRYLMSWLNLQVFYLWRHVLSTAPPFILWWSNLEILFAPFHRSSPFIGGLRCQAIQTEHGPYIAERTQKQSILWDVYGYRYRYSTVKNLICPIFYNFYHRTFRNSWYSWTKYRIVDKKSFWLLISTLTIWKEKHLLKIHFSMGPDQSPSLRMQKPGFNSGFTSPFI
jgi:hypothetical protein